MIKRRSVALLSIFITIAMAFIMYADLSILELVENKLIDYRFKARGAIHHENRVIIAAIDEKSIEKLGRWPWSRDKLAAMVDKLAGSGAELICFDIILSEKEQNDPALGRSLYDAGTVVLPIVFDFDRKATLDTSKIKDFSLSSVLNPEKFEKYPPILARRALIPVPELLESSMGIGYINMFPDSDGTLRWESLVAAYDNNLYPSFTLETAALYLGIPQDRVILNSTESVQLGKTNIPTDKWGRTLINYYGPERTFLHIPISDIIEGKFPPDLFKGKIVLVGATAIGIYDLRVTPFSAGMPGIEKHASVISSILDDNLLKTVPLWTNISILLATGIAFSLLIYRFKAAGAYATTAFFLIFTVGGAYYLFSQKGVIINMALPSLNIIFIFVCATAYKYIREERFSRKIRSMFSNYVTERVVEALIKNPEMAKLGGERREVTVLFSDIRGFTTFSEKHSPENVVAILNEYLGAMTEVIFKWEGTLDKFIGDAIVVFWGAPLKQENHAELALRCSLHMIKRLEDLQRKWTAEGKDTLDIGIGLNTGEVLVGNIGAQGKKMDYTVIGDHVNLGARVESLTKRYHAHILMTEFTMDKVRHIIEGGKVGHLSIIGQERVVVKGKEQPVGLYQIKSLTPEEKSVFVECPEDVVVMKEK